MINNSKNIIISFVTLLYIYSALFLHCFLYLFGKENESGQLKFVYIIVTMFSLIILIFKKNITLYKKQFIGILSILLILILFYVTKLIYHENNLYYNSELLLFIAVIPCTIILPIILSKIKEFNYLIFTIFNTIATLIVFIVSITSQSMSTGGLIHDSNGMLYQNISYYASFLFGISIYLIQELNYTNKKIKLFIFILMLIQGFMCIMSGGRGGFVLFSVLVLYYITIVQKSQLKKILIILFVITLFIVLLAVIPNISLKYQLNSSGFVRILDMVSMKVNVDSGRNALHEIAIENFWIHPLFGNGIGSVFYIMNTYSHNCFIDALCETGIIGLGIFLFLLIKYLIVVKNNYFTDSITRFFFVVFICGFVMNLFSGYIIVNAMVLLPIFYELTTVRKLR